VAPRDVTLGEVMGKRSVIQTGIEAGETVVTDGQLRLIPGSHIKPVPASNVDSRVFQ
jgi:multidrug efflux pump subunit AcrA (membrane-fusion protein)